MKTIYKIGVGIIVIISIMIIAMAQTGSNYTAVVGTLHIVEQPGIQSVALSYNLTTTVDVAYIENYYGIGNRAIYRSSVPVEFNSSQITTIPTTIAQQVKIYGKNTWNITVNQVLEPQYTRIII